MTRTHTIHIQRNVIWSLFAILATLTALYMYFISFSIVHVVLQKETEQAISKENARLGTLEAKLIASRRAITEDVVLAQGFVPVARKQFATRSSLLTTALVVPRGF